MFIIFFSFIQLFFHTVSSPSPVLSGTCLITLQPFSPLHPALSLHFTFILILSLSLSHASFALVMVQMLRNKDWLPFPLSVSPSRSLISLLLELVIVPLLSRTISNKYICDGLLMVSLIANSFRLLFALVAPCLSSVPVGSHWAWSHCLISLLCKHFGTFSVFTTVYLVCSVFFL